MVAARFKQMNIPTLVIDQLPRLGDKWRNRYESLTLHTTRTHDQCRYLLHPQSKSLTLCLSPLPVLSSKLATSYPQR